LALQSEGISRHPAGAPNTTHRTPPTTQRLPPPTASGWAVGVNFRLACHGRAATPLGRGRPCCHCCWLLL